MKWLLLIITTTCVLLVRCDKSDGPRSTRPESPLQPVASDRTFSLDSKKHKRGLPTFSHGVDIPIIKHSILKPFIVQYPVQSIPIGVKIPLKNPHLNKFPSHKFPLHASGSKFPHVQSPIHLPTLKPAWPTNCGHGQATQPVHRPVAPPPPAPIVPTSSVNLPVNIIPAPAFTPVLPLPRPPIPFKPLLPIHPPIFGPVPFAPAALAPVAAPIAPIAPIAPVAPLAPAVVQAAPVASVLRPGHSLHTSYFATFPRHPFVNSVPLISPHIPVVGSHIAPIAHPAPVAAPLAPLTPIAPVAPISPFGIGRFPVGVSHVPLGINKIPFSVPFGISKIPFGVANPPLIANPVPTGNIPINFPVGNAPFGHTFVGGPTQIPVQTAGNIPQSPFFVQRPEAQFPPQAFPSQFPPEIAGNPAFIPGNQDGSDFSNTVQNTNPIDSNVWTPMPNPSANPDNAFPTIQYPQQFPQEDTSQFQPQGENTNDQNDQKQGYIYQQNGNQAFQDGQDIQESLRQQAQQHFLNAQQLFSQQQVQQENQEQQQDAFNQNELQEQQYQQQQYEAQQEEEAQQYSHQQFITGQQLADSNPQHDPQFPQALPDHPLSGKSINQVFRVNHRRRQRPRPAENQES